MQYAIGRQSAIPEWYLIASYRASFRNVRVRLTLSTTERPFALSVGAQRRSRAADEVYNLALT